MKKSKVSVIGNAHSDWLRSLEFYAQELNLIKSRLTAIGGNNTGKQIGAKLEQFENQVIVQRDNIDRLRHEIHANVKLIRDQAITNGAMYIESSLREQHERLGEEVASEALAVSLLRKNFNQFSSSWM